MRRRVRKGAHSSIIKLSTQALTHACKHARSRMTGTYIQTYANTHMHTQTRAHAHTYARGEERAMVSKVKAKELTRGIFAK